MARIQHLPEHIIARISAGEILERPASALKELLENAVDAGASRIVVRFQGGGTVFLEVEDNGMGMDKEDLQLCWIRHATSKLNDEDLTVLPHYGFRGEALAAIAAAADLTVRSRPAQGEALEIQIRHGRASSPKPCVRSQGTTVIMERLFSGTPARLKFLKTDDAEKRALMDVLKRFSLFHPEIRFEACERDRDGRMKTIWSSVASNSESTQRLRDVFGPSLIEHVTPILTQEGAWRLHGHIGNPEQAKGHSGQMVLAVNGRLVQDKALTGAVRAAFRERLANGKHPTAILNLQCPHEEVDVNVHPAKQDVRFREPGRANGLIVKSIQSALRRFDNTEHPHSLAQDAHSRIPQGTLAPTNNTLTHKGSHPRFTQGQGLFTALENPQHETRPNTKPSGQNTQHLCLGVAHNQHAIVVTPTGTLIVDIQDATRRRLQQEWIEQVKSQTPCEHILPIPDILSPDPDQLATLTTHQEPLRILGWTLEPFGHGSLVLRSVPTTLKTAREHEHASLLLDLVPTLKKQEKQTQQTLMENLVAHSVQKHLQTSWNPSDTQPVDALIRALNTGTLIAQDIGVLVPKKDTQTTNNEN